MADDDDLYEDEDDFSGEDDGGLDGEGGGPGGGARGDEDGIGISLAGIKEWMTARRGWVLILGLAVAQGIFAIIVIHLRSQSTPVAEIRTAAIRDFATDMLGHEVKVNQIYQLLPMRGGKRLTVGLDLVLVLGQLPEERVEGAERPNAEEMAVFIGTIGSMEPAIRSMVNLMLQQAQKEEFGSLAAQTEIKNGVMKYVNDTLDSLDFSGGVRPEIGKRRVTEVLLPMFVTQYL